LGISKASVLHSPHLVSSCSYNSVHELKLPKRRVVFDGLSAGKWCGPFHLMATQQQAIRGPNPYFCWHERVKINIFQGIRDTRQRFPINLFVSTNSDVIVSPDKYITDNTRHRKSILNLQGLV
jgi:hypothetical protein